MQYHGASFCQRSSADGDCFAREPFKVSPKSNTSSWVGPWSISSRCPRERSRWERERVTVRAVYLMRALLSDARLGGVTRSGDSRHTVVHRGARDPACALHWHTIYTTLGCPQKVVGSPKGVIRCVDGPSRGR